MQQLCFAGGMAGGSGYDVLGGGGGYLGHATQSLVKSARVRTIITLR